MKNPIIIENGKAHPMTDEQRAEWERMREESGEIHEPPPSEAERITDLEAQNAELRRMIEALANGDTGVTA